MPLVLSRAAYARPNDYKHMSSLRDAASARHRFNRLSHTSPQAASIEYAQKAAYERSIKKPFLPEPSSLSGYSSPEWDSARACWLCYALSDTSSWKAWDALAGRWVEIGEFDRCEFRRRRNNGKVERGLMGE